jgi:hypothetical protein
MYGPGFCFVDFVYLRGGETQFRMIDESFAMAPAQSRKAYRKAIEPQKEEGVRPFREVIPLAMSPNS